LIAIALDIDWINVDERHNLTINNTLLGHYNDSSIKLQRELLWKYIEHKRPPWTKHLYRGVKHARMRITDTNEKQVFQDLNLFVEPDETDHEIIAWWARAAIFSRSIDNQSLLETGNRGEMLSLNYERSRTGQDPIHAAFYSHSYGYDIQSQVGREDTNPLYIEVKSSTEKWQVAKLFLSRPEFNICVKKGASYIFHLWDLSGKMGKLLIVNGNEIQKRAPIDTEGGEWANMSVAFSEFNWKEVLEAKVN
jgi:DNA-dependent RNA polymerase auxiliary subunit epsilon